MILLTQILTDHIEQCPNKYKHKTDGSDRIVPFSYVHLWFQTTPPAWYTNDVIFYHQNFVYWMISEYLCEKNYLLMSWDVFICGYMRKDMRFGTTLSLIQRNNIACCFWVQVLEFDCEIILGLYDNMTVVSTPQPCLRTIHNWFKGSDLVHVLIVNELKHFCDRSVNDQFAVYNRWLDETNKWILLWVSTL